MWQPHHLTAVMIAVAACDGAASDGPGEPVRLPIYERFAEAHDRDIRLDYGIPQATLVLVRGRARMHAQAPDRPYEPRFDELVRFAVARICPPGTDVSELDIDRMFPPSTLDETTLVTCGTVILRGRQVATYAPPVVDGTPRPAAPPPPPTLDPAAASVIGKATLGLLRARARTDSDHFDEVLHGMVGWLCGPGRAPADLDRMYPRPLLPRARQVVCGGLILGGGRPVVTSLPPRRP